MPLYQYTCNQCGTEIDKMMKISEREDSVIEYCQECQSEQEHSFRIGAPGISYLGVNHGHKITSDLKNRFDQIRKHFPEMRSNY